MPQIQGVVAPPSSASINDGNTVTTFLQGKAGELVDAKLRGDYFTANYRGRSFLAATAAAGVTPPVSSSTAPTFTLYNPFGSGTVVELLRLTMGLTVVTSVASPILLGYISGLLVGPTSVTSRAVTSANLGLATTTPVTQLYTAATLAAAATTFATVGQVTATNATAGNGLGGPIQIDLNGSIILQPGSLVHVCGTAAQTSPFTISAWFSEWPA